MTDQFSNAHLFNKSARVNIPALDVHHPVSFGNTQMGFSFDDVINALNPINQTNLIISGIATAVNEIGKQLAYIDWAQLGENINDASHVVANALIQIDPVHQSYMLFSTNPITGHTYMELDKFSGGLMTSVDNIWTLPLRVIRGDAITSAELADDAMLLLKVAAVIVAIPTGGATLAIVAGSASQLKKGTLGQTETGRTILSIIEAAGYAALAEQSIGEAVYKTSTNIALSAAQTETIKQTGLEGSELGRIAVGAGFAAGGGELVGTGAGDGLTNYAQNTTINEAARATPGGDVLAKYIMKYGISKPELGLNESGRSSFWDSFEMPDLASMPGRLADSLLNINISLPDFSKPSFSFPEVSAPSFSAPELNVGQLPNIPYPFPSGPSRKPIFRRKTVVRGHPAYQYCFENPSGAVCQDVPREASVWPYATMFAIGFLLFRKSRSKSYA